MTVANSKRSMRVMLAGWYGAANFGDDLLLATVAEWIREAGGTPVAISVHPTYTRTALGVESIPYTGLAEIVEAMLDTDLFVLGGGGLFQDYDRLDGESMARFPALNATQFAQFFHLASQLGLPTVALAQGVGPLRVDASRQVTAGVFRAADRISVRDTESAALLAAIGVVRAAPIAPDPVWAYQVRHEELDIAALIPEVRGRNVLGVNLRNWPFDTSWESRFVDAFAQALPLDWSTVWIDFQRTPASTGSGFIDDEIASRMIARLQGRGHHVVFDARSMHEALSVLGSCNAVLAMRLHGVLTGHRAGKPVVALEYDDKVRALGDALRVPEELRVPLQEIPQRMASAISLLTSPGGATLALSAETIASLADSALAHRQILWDAMASASCVPKLRAPRVPPLLQQWLQTSTVDAPRITKALGSGRRPEAEPGGVHS
jgi:polysaccharide pyruvyl transferase CsaB